VVLLFGLLALVFGVTNLMIFLGEDGTPLNLAAALFTGCAGLLMLRTAMKTKTGR
jgi:hypothetical protein